MKKLIFLILCLPLFSISVLGQETKSIDEVERNQIAEEYTLESFKKVNAYTEHLGYTYTYVIKKDVGRKKLESKYVSKIIDQFKSIAAQYSYLSNLSTSYEDVHGKTTNTKDHEIITAI